MPRAAVAVVAVAVAMGLGACGSDEPSTQELVDALLTAVPDPSPELEDCATTFVEGLTDDDLSALEEVGSNPESTDSQATITELGTELADQCGEEFADSLAP